MQRPELREQLQTKAINRCEHSRPACDARRGTSWPAWRDCADHWPRGLIRNTLHRVVTRRAACISDMRLVARLPMARRADPPALSPILAAAISGKRRALWFRKSRQAEAISSPTRVVSLRRH